MNSYDCHTIVVYVPQHSTNRLVLRLKAQCVFCTVVTEYYSHHFQGLVDQAVSADLSLLCLWKLNSW